MLHCWRNLLYCLYIFIYLLNWWAINVYPCQSCSSVCPEHISVKFSSSTTSFIPLDWLKTFSYNFLFLFFVKLFCAHTLIFPLIFLQLQFFLINDNKLYLVMPYQVTVFVLNQPQAHHPVMNKCWFAFTSYLQAIRILTKLFIKFSFGL